MKRFALVLVALFILALAIAIGRRLSDDVMTVIVGIVIGVGASVPCALLLGYIVTREQRPAQPPAQHIEYHLHQERTVYVQGPTPRARFETPQSRAIVRRGDD